ncbi:muscle M-line assembly protein unc-89-like [Xiphophorus maculatus]|uniref:muscle M-line assembly protein unc-89-like n=1 Tax=Xiphophorus maculatus TaxID=8083 RepID=UPI000C6DAB59|nr:muscle M-line assembly protein unc-89-like [Xiphophorus maculatus]
MANTTTTQASYITVDAQADECLENVPPRDPKAVDSSKLENAENFTLQLEEDGADAFISSTPASKNKTSDFQAKSLLSGVQSALTPVLKDLNIWNKSASPELFKLQNSPNPAVPSNFHAANCQKSTGDSRTQKIGEDISMINDECLPEVTLSDLTSDSMLYLTMNDSVFPERQHATPQLYSKKTNTSDHQNSFCAKVDDSVQSAISFRGICNEYLQDITLLEVTRASPVGDMSFMDMEDDRATSDHSDQIMTEKSDTITIEELSSKSGNSAQSSRQNSIKAALEVTQDVTLENSKSSSESSGQKVEKSQNPVDSTQVINVTRDLCSSYDVSNSVDISSSGTERSTYEVCPEPRGNPDCIEVEMVTKESQQSPESETGGQKLEMYQSSDTLCIQAINITQENPPGCDTSVQTARLPADMDKSSPELESEPKEKLEELPTSCDTESTNKESQQTLKPDVSANGTFALEQPSIQTISIVNNETLDLPPTNVSYAKDVKESGDQQTSVDSKTEASFVVHQSSSDAKETTFAVGQNATVDGDPLQKSKLHIGSAMEKTPAPLGQWNGSFDYKLPSQLNGTITLAEISSNDSHQIALGSSSTSKARNATITLKDGCSENNSSKLQTNEAAEPETKKDGSPNMTFEAAEPETKKDGSPNMTFEAAEPETKKDRSPNMTFEAAEPETKKDRSPNMTFEAAEPETKKDGSPNMTFEAALQNQKPRRTEAQT